jgi:hypothetical protein
MGAWYWQNRQAVFAACLALMNRRNHARGEGFWPLLALSKIRFTENTAGLENRPWPAGVDADALRVLLARRENPEPGESLSALHRRIGAALATAREAFGAGFGFLSEDGLQAWLDSLGDHEAVLTYHIGSESAFALLGAGGRVRRISLPRPDGLERSLDAARRQISMLDGAAFDRLMDDLGPRLLAPLAPALPDTVFFIPSGPLLGLPFDALRLDGRYLGNRHRVVNLLRFPSIPDPGRAFRSISSQHVFLAGDPSDWSGEYLSHLEVSPELRAVTDVFVGPGLSIVQGGALQPDEFMEDRFLSADLVHLAMPAYFALGEPGDSSLELSEAGRGRGRTRLGLEDIRGWRLQTGLVFISTSRLGGQPLSSHDGRLGPVPALLDAGAGAVIASLWVGGDDGSEAMIGDFYRRLAAGAGPAAALAGSKRARMDAGDRDWARLQLFIE